MKVKIVSKHSSYSLYSFYLSYLLILLFVQLDGFNVYDDSEVTAIAVTTLDMTFTRGNLQLRDHKQNNKKVLLFTCDTYPNFTTEHTR